LRLLATAAAAVALIPATAHAADVAAVGAQQKLTRIGPDGNLAFSAHDPAIAYNSVDDEFLLAWLGRDPAAPGETEVYGQILDATGKPDGPVRRLSTVAGTPEQPVVSYSSAVNTYILAYVAPPPAGPNNPSGQEEIIGQIVTATGAPSGEPARISDTDPFTADSDQASDPAVAYDPAHDQFRFVWRADTTVEGDFEVQTRRVSSTLIDADGIPSFQVSNMAAGDADEPDIVYLPAQERYVIAWEGDVAVGDSEIFVEVERFDSTIVTNDTQVSVAAGSTEAVRPSLAANPRGNEAIVAFLKNDIAGEGPEAFFQRLSSTGAQVPPNTPDVRISTMGPAANQAFGANLARTTTATYHPLLDQYFVTWAADNDLPGMVDQEFERYGQALDAAGREVGVDDIRLSTTGVDGATNTAPEDGATAASGTRRAWLHVWEADDNRPPMADNEFELFGRLAGDDGDLDGAVAPADCNDADAAIRPGANEVIDNGIDEDCSGADTENLDRDADGSPRPADCNDGNGAVRPGAADVTDNGLDEDCSGADAVNLDRDGDGSLRPVDCNDANRAIRPGARDIPRNRVDEDCSGKDAAFPTLGANVSNSWDVNGASFRLLTLAITQQFPKGMKAQILCKGTRCPFKTKSLKLGKVRRGARNAIASLSSRQRRFRAGQTVEVFVSAPGFNTKVARMPLKLDKVPRVQSLCAVPGSKTPRRSCG
jgi:hypothetical protein